MKPIGIRHVNSLVRRPKKADQAAIHNRVPFVVLDGGVKYFPRGLSVGDAVKNAGWKNVRGTGWVMRASKDTFGVGRGSSVSDFYPKADDAAVGHVKTHLRGSITSVRGGDKSNNIEIME